MSEPYHRPISSTTWWLSKRNYVLFMLRELTSVFIAAFLIVYLIQLAQLAQGAEAYTAFLDRLASPGWIVFHLLVLIAALYHTITFFNLTPKIIVVRRGEESVPPVLIAGSHYAAWLVTSVVIMWIVLRS
jgi:fumarate reductase subunit C